MNRKPIYLITIAICLTLAINGFKIPIYNNEILSYTVDPKEYNIQLYWKDDQGNNIRSIQNLKGYLEKNGKKLVFAMNGGMYNTANAPQGLFVENGEIIAPLDTSSGKGNFYLKPNGVFGITITNQPYIINTIDFKYDSNIKFATQSGPMLVIDGEIHKAFMKRSTNLNIRNGVGILPDNKIVFAISKSEINFYEFADYFKNLGCKQALYLDGFVSRAYLPEKNWTQLDGNFGVIIGVTERK